MTCVIFRMRLAPNRNGHGVYQSSHVDRVPSPFGGLKSPAMAVKSRSLREQEANRDAPTLRSPSIGNWIICRGEIP